MKKTSLNLQDYINWEKVMKVPRYAGGHEEVMENLFGGGSFVVFKYIQSDYQGEEVFIYFTPLGYAVVSDYFGSCSVCDSWDDASDEEATHLLKELAINAHLFNQLTDALQYLLELNKEHDIFP